jgi:7-carboxy-7-deazaguanine synthase
VAEIVEQVAAFETRHVVLTGGEPMLFAELVPLSEELRRLDKHITIETAGTLFLPVACDLMSISPKRANSTPTEETAGKWSARHERSRHVPSVIARLIAEYEYQLKFVIDAEPDVADVAEYLREFPQIDRERVLLMPQGTSVERLQATGAWLEPLARMHGWRYSPRKQIEWFGLARGT